MKHAAHSSYGGKLGWLPSLGLWFVLWLVLTGCKAGKDVSQFMQKGETFLTAGELEKAKIEFLNVLRLQSTNTLALTRLAKINFDQGATLQALPLLIRLKDLAPNPPR